MNKDFTGAKEILAWIKTLEKLSYNDLCLLWNGISDDHLLKEDIGLRKVIQNELKFKSHEANWR